MKRSGGVFLAVIAGLAASAAAPAQDVSEMDVVPYLVPPLPQGQSYSYGREGGQWLELTVPRVQAPPAIIVLIDNDGQFAAEAKSANSDWLPIFLYDRGYAVARLHYQRSEKVGAKRVMADLVAGLARLNSEARRAGADPSRLVLVSKGGGAHHTFLLGTDPTYFGAAGISFANLRAIVALNPVGFDIPKRIAGSSNYRARQYERVFGQDLREQQRLSPATHMAAPNVAKVQIFVVDDQRNGFIAQAHEIASAFASSGSQSDVRTVAAHRDSASSSLGASQHPATARLSEFLDSATR